MAYGTDQTVFVEDKLGDLGAPGSSPFWLSPDVDIPAHSGQAVQGSNDVRIRVHAHEEPFLEEKIVAEVYVGEPSLVLSPTTGTKRIDPGNLLFRPPNIGGTEPIANEAGGTLSFPWTPSPTAANVDGPGHRCLIVRAFPESVTPPSSPFDVPNEAHEAQHNLEILTTTKVQADMIDGGAGTRDDPRKRDAQTGMWWERFTTLAGKKRGDHFVLWAFDPTPDDLILATVKASLGRRKFSGFSQDPPERVEVEPEDTRGERINPAKVAGGKRGLFTRKRLVAAARLSLGPRKPSHLLLRFDHSNIDPGTAVVLHCVQLDETGAPQGGMTVIALAPNGR